MIFLYKNGEINMNKKIFKILFVLIIFSIISKHNKKVRS